MTNAGERNLMYLAGGGVQRYTTAKSTVTGNYKAIYMCRSCSFSSIVATDITNASAIGTGTTFAAGVVLQGNITSVALDAGACMLVQ